MRRFGLALGAFSVAASLAGCGTMAVGNVGSSQFKGLGFTTKSDAKEWTIMLHLAGSNNLESFAFKDMNEAEAGLTSDKINFIVLFDGTKKGDSKIIKITHDPAGYNNKLVSPTIDDKGAVIPTDTKEIDSGDYRTVSKFVDFAVKNFPAKKYAFMSWDHGSGIFTPSGQRVNLGPGVDRQALKQQFARQNVTISPLGFGWDDETGNHVTTAQFTPILETAAKAAGAPIDLAGFDACLMAHTEMAYQMKGFSKNMVASEELEPGDGWDYRGWLKYASANPSVDGAGLAGMLVKSFYESYTPGGNQFNGRQWDITLSNISYDTLKNDLVPALNTLADDLLASMPNSSANLKSIRQATQDFYNSDCADLGNFLDRLSATRTTDRVRESAKKVRAAYSKSVTAEAHAGNAMANATGQAIYFPTSKWQWKKAYEDANQIAFAGEKWGKFLAEFVK